MRERRLPLHGFFGGFIVVAGLYLLLTDTPGLNTAWFLFAWYGYLLFLDALTYWKSKQSILVTYRRDAVAMFVWSIPFWFLFEAYNLAIENWYYVFVPRSLVWRIFFSLLAFATVLPACFFHAEFLRVHHAFSGWFGPRIAFTLSRQRMFAALGAACIILPLLFPALAFPLVWGITFFIPEILNYRKGAVSLMRDAEAGDYRRIARIFFGGLMAGGVWEACNYGARCKWIYTVPGFESFKLFEMPLLGFLGFPVFALSAFSFFSFLNFFIRGEGRWESDRLQYSRPSTATKRFALTLAAAVSVFAFIGGQLKTTRSIRPLLSDVETLDTSRLVRLEECVRTPERLERADPVRLTTCSGLPRDSILEAQRFAGLMLHKGMGPQFASLLWEMGIRSVSDLAEREPEALAASLREIVRAKGNPLQVRIAEVRIWVHAAQTSGRCRDQWHSIRQAFHFA